MTKRVGYLENKYCMYLSRCISKFETEIVFDNWTKEIQFIQTRVLVHQHFYLWNVLQQILIHLCSNLASHQCWNKFFTQLQFFQGTNIFDVLFMSIRTKLLKKTYSNNYCLIYSWQISICSYFDGTASKNLL